MSVTSLRSAEDLKQFLEQQETGSGLVAVSHDAASNLAPALVALVRHVGHAGQPVRLLAPDELSASRWARTFAEAGLRSEDVCSVRAAALSLIESAGAAFPRDGRLLDANEMDVLMEDMKVSGLKPRRLREMTKFFFKGMADGEEDNPAWLITEEERSLFALLKENLEARRALVPEEVCARALEALENPSARKAAATLVPPDALLIAVDFNTLSRTGQALVRALADRALVATGTRLDACNGEEDYPHPAGFAALADEADALAMLADATAPTDEALIAAHPAEEFEAVAQRVTDAVEGGRAPADILIACPNRLWIQAIGTRLEARGIPFTTVGASAKTKGDPREAARCGRLRTRALGKLMADPLDFTAWRSWLGLGDWLVGSDAFHELLTFARENGKTAPEAFAELVVEPDDASERPAFHKFKERARSYDALRAALAEATGEEGVALIESQGCALEESQRTALAAQPRFDASQAALILLQDGTDDEKADPSRAVALVPYRSAFGFHRPLAIICGLVSGFLPSLDATSDSATVDHRRRAYQRDRILFETLKAAASETLVLSRFTDDRAENADTLGMDVARIYLKDKEHHVTVAPCPYLTDTSPVPSLPTAETQLSGIATTA